MGEVKLPDYNAMPHLPPAELIAKETEQLFSGWTGVGAAPAASDYTTLERKCQELEREHAAAQAELARLRAEVERLSDDAKLIDWIEGQFKPHSMHMDGTSAFALTGKELRGLRGRTFRDAVAEACGRKG